MIRTWDWWYVALVWLAVLALSWRVGFGLARPRRASAGNPRGPGYQSGPALPLWLAVLWLLMVIVAAVLTWLWWAGRAAVVGPIA